MSDQEIVSDVSRGTAPDGEMKVPCEVYSRIVGYLRPVQAWNDGKRREFEERLTFKTPDAPSAES
jgi:anaerobic ribonucleoside-triphosphate reductase